jgi:hypothetical protein
MHEITGSGLIRVREFGMNRRLLFIAFMFAFTLMIGAKFAIGSPSVKEITLTGTVTDTIDGASEAEPSRVTENVREHGALYAIVDSKTKRVYVLNPQNVAAPFAGRQVVVKGTMDSATITITASSITAAPAKPAK